MTTATKTHPSFKLLEAAAAIDLTKPPAHYQLDSVKDGETVVGAMSESLARVHRVRSDLIQVAELQKQEVDRENADHGRVHREGQAGQQECSAHSRRIAELQVSLKSKRVEVSRVDGIFWRLLLLEFPELSEHIGESMAIREEGRVVWFSKNDEEDSDELETFKEVSDALAQAFGGRPSSGDGRGPLDGIQELLRSQLGGRGRERTIVISMGRKK